MKLKKVAALCSSNRVFRLYDQVDAQGVAVQWLGDGNAIYPLDGLPFLDEGGLYRMFDVSEKAQEKISFHHDTMPEGLNVDDYAAGEIAAEDMGVTISYGGTILLPLRTVAGILYIQSRYLAPLEDQADFLQLFVRRDRLGGRYIAAKVGMLLRGVIMPYNAVVCDSLADRLDEIARMTRREAERRKYCPAAVQPMGDDQTSLLEREPEGETDED